MNLNSLFIKIKSLVKLNLTKDNLAEIVRKVNYYCLDPYIKLNFLNTDFSKYGKDINLAADGKRWNIHNPKYWDVMWEFWRESKQLGKSYYYDVPQICVENNLRKIFELGCGPGYLISRFKNLNIKEYYGCDISKASIRMAREKIKGDSRFKLEIQNIENCLSKIESYDCVIAVDVLEHLPKELIDKVIKTTNDNEKIKFIFICPYLNFVPSPGHIQCFSKRKFYQLFNNHKLNFIPYNKYREFMIKNF